MNPIKFIHLIKPKLFLIFGISLLLLVGCSNSPAVPTSTDALPESADTAPANASDSAAATPAPATATPLPAPTPMAGGSAKVFFLSDRDNEPGHFDIYVMALASKEISRITTSAIQKHNLVVSPDGRWGAFVTGDDDADLIYTVDLSQSNPEPVLVTPDMPRSRFPIWSPDSQRLAFEHDYKTAQSIIYTVNPDGSDLRQISNDEDFNVQPVWSPDSQQIGYTKSPNEGRFAGAPLLGFSQAYIANADGSGQTQIVDMNGYQESAPHWSFDGKSLIFMSETTGQVLLSGLFQVEPGSEAPMLLAEGSEQGWFFDAYYVVHSPAGNRVALLALSAFTGNWAVNTQTLYSMRPDGSELTILHEYSAPFETADDDTNNIISRVTIPSWTPDGTAMIVDDAQNLFLVNVITGERTQLTDTGHNVSAMIVYDADTAHVEQPAGDETTHLEIYPPLDIQGSGVIAYISDQASTNAYDSPTNNEVFLYGLESGETQRVTHNLEDEMSLIWSPDGRRLAYIGGEGENAHLFVLDYASFINEGTRPVQITDLPGKVTAPAWSPDSAQIAFVHQPDSEAYNTQLYTISVDGSELTPRSFTPGLYQALSWSPSGMQLSYTYSLVSTFQGAPLISEPSSFILSISDNATSQIPQEEGYRNYGPLWTAEGLAVFYWKSSDFEESHLAVRNIESGEEFVLSSNLPLSGNKWIPAWSPSGDFLTFFLTDWEPFSNKYYASGLYIFSLLGSGNPNNVDLADWFENGISIQAPAWSPQSDWVAFTSSDTPEGRLGIYIVDADGNNYRRISDATHHVHSPAWGAGQSNDQ